MAALLAQSYRQTGERLLLGVALGFAALVALALWQGSYFLLLPAILTAAALYWRAGQERPAPGTHR